jgi:hypothetical protein
MMLRSWLDRLTGARPGGRDDPGDGLPSYHDLHVTTAQIPRASIFDLPYGLIVTCARTTGWRLEDADASRGRGEVLAGEYEDPEQWLVLDVAGHVIVDSRRPAE